MTSRDRLYDRWKEMARWWHGGTAPGRNELPGCVHSLYDAGEFGVPVIGVVDAALLAVAVEDAWTSAEFPELSLFDVEQWSDMFFAARTHLAQPIQPVTLYRGVSDESRSDGMAWTGSVEVARWFAKRFNAEGDGMVFVLRNVEPENILARIIRGRGADGVAEDEYVLAPVFLDTADIQLYEDHRSR